MSTTQAPQLTETVAIQESTSITLTLTLKTIVIAAGAEERATHAKNALVRDQAHFVRTAI